MPKDVRKIYITHCSAKKNSLLLKNKESVTPDKLYTATPTQRFMSECKNKKVNWAILSDKYGMWFSDDLHEWYEKDPSMVTDEEFDHLVRKFDRSLKQYEQIYFYHNPGRFHKLYKSLLKSSRLQSKIKLFTHLNEITSSGLIALFEKCKWLHDQLELLPIFKYPFDPKLLPNNGIYFFYEEGEVSDHGDGILRPRIVRIGTHKENNFRTRISEHFLLNESRMKFTLTNPKPSDRSIFRKNIGRALLNKQGDSDYLRIWNIDYTSRTNRTKYSQSRKIDREKDIESQITGLLRKHFSFRFIPLEGQGKRMGKTGMESRLISTVASCTLCSQSTNWLGKYSPIPKIQGGKMWLSQHLDSTGLTDNDLTYILKSIAN
jgi:hypothetical protein